MQRHPDSQEQHLNPAQVWRALEKGSFAVIGFVTPRGQPRTSGVMYIVESRRLFVGVDAESWKARYVKDGDEVSVTATMHRGGILALLLPIPPATVTFRAVAAVFPADRPGSHALPARLARRLPDDRRHDVSVIELTPVEAFVTYGVGVSLRHMADPKVAKARVPTT